MTCPQWSLLKQDLWLLVSAVGSALAAAFLNVELSKSIGRLVNAVTQGPAPRAWLTRAWLIHAACSSTTADIHATHPPPLTSSLFQLSLSSYTSIPPQHTPSNVSY